jgi:hypothetical protein
VLLRPRLLARTWGSVFGTSALPDLVRGGCFTRSRSRCSRERPRARHGTRRGGWHPDRRLIAGQASDIDYLIAGFRIPRSEDVDALIDESGVDTMGYNKRWGRYRLRLKPSGEIDKYRGLQVDLIQRASGTTPPPIEDYGQLLAM